MRSLEYFRIRTIPQLSGFFDSKFWSRYILLAAIHEPAIRHAVVALGSLHERFEAGDPSILRSNSGKLEGGFALQQYTRAISRLLDPLFKNLTQSLDVALTASVLFTCFEVTKISVGLFCEAYVDISIDSQRTSWLGNESRSQWHPDVARIAG